MLCDLDGVETDSNFLLQCNLIIELLFHECVCQNLEIPQCADEKKFCLNLMCLSMQRPGKEDETVSLIRDNK